MNSDISKVVNEEVRLRNIVRNSKQLMLLANKTSTNSEQREIMIETISGYLERFRELTMNYVGEQIKYAQEIYKRIQDYAERELNQSEYDILFQT